MRRPPDLATVMLLGLLAGAGCATEGPVVTLEIRAPQAASAVTAGSQNALRVTVHSFEDARPQQGRIGVHHHFWGSETVFDVAGGKPDAAVSKTVADLLQRRGWQTAEIPSGAAQPDVILAGKVVRLTVEAQSKLGRTTISVKTQLALEARNTADGSLVRMNLLGEGEQSVFWFDPDDAQELLNAVLAASLDKFLQTTKADQHRLRLS